MKSFQDLRDRAYHFFHNDPAGTMVLAMLTPNPPYDKSKWVSALVAASSMVCIATLAGMAISALAVLLLALALLSLVVTRVMGIEFSLPKDFYTF